MVFYIEFGVSRIILNFGEYKNIGVLYCLRNVFSYKHS